MLDIVTQPRSKSTDMLALLLTVVTFTLADGRTILPPLPLNDGCYQVESELELFRVESEPMILSFPIFQRVLEVRKIAPRTAKYLIVRANSSAESEHAGRVQRHDQQLWLLPALASDSGVYTCTYRNESYCITGNITVYVYQTASASVDKLLYPIRVMVGDEQTLKCPSVGPFNRTERSTQWSSNAPARHRLSSFYQRRGNLLIPAVKTSDAGLYSCRVQVIISARRYNVSRIILLHVEEPEPTSSSALPDPSGTTVKPHKPSVTPPVIISPQNGTQFEGSHGSGLELFCQVDTGCQQVDSTEITWFVNGQSVESSYLDGRALEGRRVTWLSDRCRIEMRLIIVALLDADMNTELKCVAQNPAGRQEVVMQLNLQDSSVTWVVVATVATSIFLSVVSIFFYILFKPMRKKKMDYVLARQNSVF
ncbi:interleukin-1 receptor type 2-like isoform 1-T1 [Synchiropus picturatus]